MGGGWGEVVPERYPVDGEEADRKQGREIWRSSTCMYSFIPLFVLRNFTLGTCVHTHVLKLECMLSSLRTCLSIYAEVRRQIISDIEKDSSQFSPIIGQSGTLELGEAL